MSEHQESKGESPSRPNGKLTPERFARRKAALAGLEALRRRIGPVQVDVRELIDKARR